MISLEKEIQITKAQTYEKNKTKEKNLKKIADQFNFNNSDDRFKKAFKTIRKLPQFGQVSGVAVDFEWPKKKHLKKMQTDQLIRATSLKWKKNSTNSAWIGGIQVILSNGD